MPSEPLFNRKTEAQEYSGAYQDSPSRGAGLNPRSACVCIASLSPQFRAVPNVHTLLGVLPQLVAGA